MPELPEIAVIAGQMNKEIKGKCIVDVEVKQPKNLNMSIQKFVETTKGKMINNVTGRGKWIFLKLDPHYYMLIHLGMGAEILYFTSNKSPERYHFKLTLNDNTGFTIKFQWFGHIHLVSEKDLNKHKPTATLGVLPNTRTFTLKNFQKLFINRNARIKNFLLDQKNIAGIGNVYVQDILFKAKLHPNRKISTLSETEIKGLYKAIDELLNRAIQLGGLAYEKDFYGQEGKLTINSFLVGYKTGKPCPVCKAPIKKIKTGSTSSYICSICQPL